MLTWLLSRVSYAVRPYCVGRQWAKPKNMKRSLRFLLCSVGITLVPFLLFTLYLIVVTRGGFRRSTGWDDPAMATSLGVGLACVVWLPVKSGLRWGIGVFYVPIVACLLFVYQLMFVCTCCGDCL